MIGLLDDHSLTSKFSTTFSANVSTMLQRSGRGEEGYPTLAQHLELAKEALAFWTEYWDRAVVSQGLNEEQISRSLHVMKRPRLQPPQFATRLATAGSVGRRSRARDG